MGIINFRNVHWGGFGIIPHDSIILIYFNLNLLFVFEQRRDLDERHTCSLVFGIM